MFDLRLKILLTLILTLSVASTVMAAGLSDPMQPPQGIKKRTMVSSTQGDTKVRWALQSILLGPKRAIAIIDGTPVSPGERYQGARLLKIDSDGVMLQNRDGKKIVLQLTPSIHKKKVSTDTEISLR